MRIQTMIAQQVVEKVHLYVMLSAAKHPSWAQAQETEGFFARHARSE